MHANKLYLLLLAMPLIILNGCSGLLPKEKAITVGIWDSYEEAQETFDKIIPYQTTLAELNALELNPDKNSNVTILNYTEVTLRFAPGLSIDGYVLDSGVQECILAKTDCKGYEINERVLKSKRYGNFWADFLNFKRKTDIVGWNFVGIILVKNGLVVYKLSGGQPAIHEKLEKKNPLGPLQDGGTAVDVIRNDL